MLSWRLNRLSKGEAITDGMGSVGAGDCKDWTSEVRLLVVDAGSDAGVVVIDVTDGDDDVTDDNGDGESETKTTEEGDMEADAEVSG